MRTRIMDPWKLVRRHVVQIIAVIQLLLLVMAFLLYLYPQWFACKIAFWHLGADLPVAGFVAVSQVTGLTSVLFAWLVSRGHDHRCGLPLTKLYRFACGWYWISFVLFAISTLWTICLDACTDDISAVTCAKKWMLALLFLSTLFGLASMMVTSHRFIFNETLCRMYAHEYWGIQLQRNYSVTEKGSAISALARDVGACMNEHDNSGLDEIWSIFKRQTATDVACKTLGKAIEPTEAAEEYIGENISFWRAAVDGRKPYEVDSILRWGLETLLLEYSAATKKSPQDLSHIWSRATAFVHIALHYYGQGSDDPKHFFFFLSKELTLMKQPEEKKLTTQFLFELVASYTVMWRLNQRIQNSEDHKSTVRTEEYIESMRHSLVGAAKLSADTLAAIGSWTVWCYTVSQNWNNIDWNIHRTDVQGALDALQLTWGEIPTVAVSTPN